MLPREHRRVTFSSPGGLVTQPTQPLIARASGRVTQGRTGVCGHLPSAGTRHHHRAPLLSHRPGSRPRTTFPQSPPEAGQPVTAGKAGSRSALSWRSELFIHTDGKKSQQVGGRGSRRESHLPKPYCLVTYFCHQALPPKGTAALTTMLRDGPGCRSMAGHGSEQS